MIARTLLRLCCLLYPNLLSRRWTLSIQPLQRLFISSRSRSSAPLQSLLELVTQENRYVDFSIDLVELIELSCLLDIYIVAGNLS